MAGASAACLGLAPLVPHALTTHTTCALQDAIELFKIKKNEWIPHRPPIETEAGKYYR